MGNLSLKTTSNGSIILTPSDTATDKTITFPATDMIVASTIDAQNYFGFKNKIINGNFDIWQRGTAGTGGDVHFADRWLAALSGSTHSITRETFALGQTSVPGNPKYYYRSATTSVAGAANYSRTIQRIESVNLLSGKTVTLSFWAKADASKNIAVEFTQHFGTTGSPSADVLNIGTTTFALTTTWTKFTRTVTLPSISGKVLGTDNNDYTGCNFWFDAGSNHASRTNTLGQQTGTFDISRVQIEEGSIASEFEVRPISVEYEMCLRYQQTFANLEIVATYAAGMPNTANVFSMISNGFDFKKMRDVPTITMAGTMGTDWAIRNAAGTNQTGTITLAVADSGSSITMTKTAHGLTSGGHLKLITTTGKAIFLAEL